jgi:hypothetical protein
VVLALLVGVEIRPAPLAWCRENTPVRREIVDQVRTKGFEQRMVGVAHEQVEMGRRIIGEEITLRDLCLAVLQRGEEIAQQPALA